MGREKSVGAAALAVVFLAARSVHLPPTSWRAMRPGYEEVHVPAAVSSPDPAEKLVPISALPVWTHEAFRGMKSLNRVQSKMADVSLRSSENLVRCLFPYAC